ncbi:unnamed protein product [Caretta caretta]
MAGRQQQAALCTPILYMDDIGSNEPDNYKRSTVTCQNDALIIAQSTVVHILQEHQFSFKVSVNPPSHRQPM